MRVPTNLIAIVKGTLSPRSSVVADTRTSQLIVTTTEKMDALALTIEKLDTPTKQVLIEAKLVDGARAQHDQGIDWTGTLENQELPWVTTRCLAAGEHPPVITPNGTVMPGQPGHRSGILEESAAS